LNGLNVDEFVSQRVYSPTGQIPDGISWTQEDMIWIVESLSDTETKMTIDYDIVPFDYLTGFVENVGSNAGEDRL
jgi:hypothetical protein